MDRILDEADPLKAGAAWAELDRQIMAEVPGVPFVYLRAFQIMGPQIGSATLDLILGELNLNGLYVNES